MSGNIIISLNSSVRMHSYTFSIIAELSREKLLLENKNFILEIYSIFDECGEYLLTLRNLSPDGFNAFYEATYNGFQDYSRNGEDKPYFDIVVNNWKELLTAMEADPRWEEFG